jgi:hypothetical protein
MKKYKDNKNVFLYHGDSGKLLSVILGKVKRRNKTVWLDSHFSGGDTACGEKYSPLMEELSVIKYFYGKRDVILIDDIRDYKVKSEHYDFDLEDIKDKLLEINADFTFSYEDSYQGDTFMFPKDILVAK